MPRAKQPVVVDDRPLPRKPSARSAPRAKRTAARLNAVQILYQSTLTGQDLPAALIEFRDYRIGQIIEDIEIVPADAETLNAIIGGLASHAERIDQVLAASLRGSTPDRVEILLRSIMRVGIAELLVRRDLSASLIISDYLSVTEAFYDRTEIKLVNGVLDAAARSIRTDTAEIFTDL
jgi:N utilization substance protein B